MAIKDNPKLKQFLINTLRRASYRWPGRYGAMKKAHIGRNEYYCQECGIVHGRKEGAMDHIVPVIDPELGWVDLDVFAERMFVPEEGFSRLCNDCHNNKTALENQTRKKNRKK